MGEPQSDLARDYETVLLDRDGPTAIITLNRPEKYNALNGVMRAEISAALQEIRRDPSVRGVVIWGGSKTFVAGADLSEMLAKRPLDVFSPMSKSADVWSEVSKFPVPVVAAIAGACLGGGLELAMACDLRVATDNAVLGQTEVNVGLIPGRGGTQRLARLVGMTKAREMVLLGDVIKADEALRIGLINKVVPVDQLLAEAKRYVERIAEKSPQSITLAKLMMENGQDMNLDTAMMMESLAFSAMFSTDDRTEGAKAFLEKRRPRYVGR